MVSTIAPELKTKITYNKLKIMTEANVSFDCLPKAVASIQTSVNEILRKIECIQSEFGNSEKWYNLKELCEYLPDKPAQQTVYEWVNKRIIPYHKRGKKLFFLKSEIDKWMMSDNSDIQDQVQLYLNTHNRI